MRPLPDLTDLDSQPAVFDQQTDDFTSYFTDEFTGIDGSNAALAADQNDSAAGFSLFGSEVDDFGAAVDAGAAALDVLSLDLDSVDLTPIIQDFASQDAALDANLSNFAPDLTEGAMELFNAFWSIGNYIEQNIINLFAPQMNALLSEVEYILTQVNGLGLNGPGGILG